MKYFFLTVLVILLSCSSVEQPDGLIDREEMVGIMIDIHLLEAKLELIDVTPVDSTQLVFDRYESLIFEKFEVTKEEYETSFLYYVDNPQEFEKIYNAVVDSLMQMEKIK